MAERKIVDLLVGVQFPVGAQWLSEKGDNDLVGLSVTGHDSLNQR